MDVIRIQSYIGTKTKSLHLGAEIQISKKEEVIDLIRALLEIHKVLN